jgi:hypothetical protein
MTTYSLTTQSHNNLKMALRTILKDIRHFTRTHVQLDGEIGNRFRKALGKSRVGVNWNGNLQLRGHMSTNIDSGQ